MGLALCRIASWYLTIAFATDFMPGALCNHAEVRKLIEAFDVEDCRFILRMFRLTAAKVDSAPWSPARTRNVREDEVGNVVAIFRSGAANLLTGNFTKPVKLFRLCTTVAWGVSFAEALMYLP